MKSQEPFYYSSRKMTDNRCVWSKIRVRPYLPPLWLKEYCRPFVFFVMHEEKGGPRDEATKRIREICKNIIISIYGGNIEDLDALKTFLSLRGHDTNIEDTTLDDIINTALYFQFDQIYEIIHIERASNCEACRLEEPGQLAHMSLGGCLYSSDEI